MPDTPNVSEMAPPEDLGSTEKLEKADGVVESGGEEGNIEGAADVLKTAAQGDKEQAGRFGRGLLGEVVKRTERLFSRGKTSASEEEVRSKIGGVDKEIDEETASFLAIVDSVSGGKPLPVESESKNVPERPERIEGEVIFYQGEWLKDDINDETKEWLNGEGHREAARDFTEEEKEEAERFREAFYQNANREAGENPGVEEILKELFDDEGDAGEETKEAFKLLVRIAVKAGTKLAVSIARSIAKDKETSQEVRIMMRIFADGIEGAGDFTDRLIAGDSKADLEQDIIDFISDKRN